MRLRHFVSALVLGAPPLAAQSLPEWTRGATCYEIFVRSFQDSNGDGIGDFRGLISRLDYINDGNPRTSRDLGARCVWLMPVAQSPSYHGYDVTDYYTVESDYGTNDDFKAFVAAAHQRGIKVVVDMVLNHVSSQHPFFEQALRDTASQYRGWFRWSPTRGPNNRYGGNNWHKSPLRDEYYYGFFWGGMPDLNWESPAVMEEMKKAATFWLRDMGVDGFRLDAVRHLYERGDETENVPATHVALREYAAHVEAIKPDAYTIGEVWDSVGAMLPYYPDQLDSYFAFAIADSIVSAVRSGLGSGLLDPVLRLQERVPAQRWSPFVRNHDQPRTRTELGGDMAKSRLAAFLLFTMPGMPFVYYGEEIGMTGTKPDERLRTPMPWRPVAGAGFTTGKPWQQMQDDSLAITVEAQDRDPGSLLNWYRRLIRLRDANPALGSGELIPLVANDPSVAAYLRRDGDRTVLIVANLGAKPSRATLSAAAGTFRAGRWSGRSLLGGGRTPAFSPDAEGGLAGYAPLPVLAPMRGYLFELSRVPVDR